jgi:LPS-assembly lipoprotein
MKQGLNLAAGCALALGGASLGGCGFTPLYGSPTVVRGLSHIEVVAPEGRVGYLLRQDLDDALGHDQGGTPTYRLQMNISQARVAHGLTEQDVAQRYEIDMRVTYTLTEIATGHVAHTGEVISQISYDSLDAPYAGIAARQGTQELSASDVANKIQLELSAWMASHPGG